MEEININSGLIGLKDQPFIEVFRIGEVHDSVFDNYQRYDFYQLLWIQEAGGNLSYFLDFNEYTLKDNQIVLIFPGQIDRLDIEQKKGYLFAIDSNTFFEISQRLNSDYLSGYFSSHFLEPDPETRQSLNTLINLIFNERAGENRLMLIKSYMQAFLFHVAAIFEKTGLSKNTTNSRQVAELMKLIDQNFIAQRETEFYASQMGVTKKKLNLIATKGTGKTVKQHLHERLILEIKREIHIGEKSLKEIAFDLGFSEPAYFSRFFKQFTGIPPSEFKEKG